MTDKVLEKATTDVERKDWTSFDKDAAKVFKRDHNNPQKLHDDALELMRDASPEDAANVESKLQKLGFPKVEVPKHEAYQADQTPPTDPMLRAEWYHAHEYDKERQACEQRTGAGTSGFGGSTGSRKRQCDQEIMELQKKRDQLPLEKPQ